MNEFHVGRLVRITAPDGALEGKQSLVKTVLADGCEIEIRDPDGIPLFYYFDELEIVECGSKLVTRSGL